MVEDGLHDVAHRAAVFAQFARFVQRLFKKAAVEDLHGFEAGEAIRRVGYDGSEFVVIVAMLVVHRRREIRHQHGNEISFGTIKGPGGAGFVQKQGLLVAAIGEAVGAAVFADKGKADGDDERARRVDGADVLHRGNGDAALALVPGGSEGDFRRAFGGVPLEELAGKVVVTTVAHRLREVFDAHGLTVVTLDVAFHAGLEGFFAEDGVIHADDFRAFFIHGSSVEVVDSRVLLRLHGVRHRPGIFGELQVAQADDVADALQRAFAHVGGKFLIAEDSQPFFERELEPVAAGDAVAGPVVEVFVADDGADAVIVFVGGGVGISQNEAGIEDVERFVFHRPHVEVADGDDIELFEVVAESEAFFVPVNGVNQRLQGKRRLVDEGRLGVDTEANFPPLRGGDAAVNVGQVAGDEGEEVTRLGMRVIPLRVVPSARQFALRLAVAVRKQDGIVFLIRFNAYPVGGEHIGTVKRRSDTAEAFSLALGAIDAVRAVETGEFFVFIRFQAHDGTQVEVAADIFQVQQQAVVLVLLGSKRFTVDFDIFQREMFGMQDNVLVLRQFPAVFVVTGLAAHDLLDVADQHFAVVLQVKFEFVVFDCKSRRTVVRQSGSVECSRHLVPSVFRGVTGI